MILTHRSFDDIVFFSQWVIGFGLCLAFLLFAVGALRTPKIQGVSSLASHEGYDLGKIATGPLALRESRRSALALSLEQKLVFLAQSVRPDLKKEEKALCIGVKGTDQKQVVLEGKPIFCQIQEHPSGGVENLSFTGPEHGVAMIPHLLDSRSLLLKGENMELFLAASPEVKESGAGAVAALQQARCWGQDRFFQMYGGSHFLFLGQKQKLELIQNGQRDFLYIQPGDFLSLREGKWQVLTSLEEADRNALLAHILDDGDGVEIEAWDEEGFLLLKKKLDRTSSPPLNLSASQLFSELKLRTSNLVSCKVEKKRMMLREGDWLVRTKSGWHKLKTEAEIASFLQHGMAGDIFVVDAVDSGGLLKGHFFDEMRTQAQPVCIPIAQKPVTNSKRRTPLLKK